jgi:hypothetical protein
MSNKLENVYIMYGIADFLSWRTRRVWLVEQKVLEHRFTTGFIWVRIA